MDGQIIWTFGLNFWTHKIELVPRKCIWHRLEGLHSKIFECDSNKFELGKHFWKVQKCSEFLRRSGKR